MAQAICAPGDVVICPNPTYPIHEFGFIISGGAIRHVEASNDDRFLSAVSRAVKHSIPKPIAMILSYPSNPTAMTATLDFYKEAVQLAKKLDLIILSDVAYSELYFDGRSAAVGAAGARRDRHHGRVHVAVEDLQHAGLAHGLCGRQRAADRGAGAGEVLSRLRRVHADPGRGRRRAQRSAGLRRGDAARSTRAGATRW